MGLLAELASKDTQTGADVESLRHRLCLEWGRLNADDREAASYKP